MMSQKYLIIKRCSVLCYKTELLPSMNEAINLVFEICCRIVFMCLPRSFSVCSSIELQEFVELIIYNGTGANLTTIDVYPPLSFLADQNVISTASH